MTDKAKRRDPRVGVEGANRDRGRLIGKPVCGVRMDKALWETAKVKAEEVGTTRNEAIVRLIEAFVSGAIELPS